VKAGTQIHSEASAGLIWVPAFAGMSGLKTPQRAAAAHVVMPGLDPGIHGAASSGKDTAMDPPIKSGDDGWLGIGRREDGAA
jgi:hypothetical protein